ncbi:MAG: hypothetical protein Q8N35_14945 [Methylococcaceae bacterium]|nr:hypothetical protein [Methylococcaceae bacterium]MDP3020878.1 hypothetical protein [Methylococcaceae bacterium]
MSYCYNLKVTKHGAELICTVFAFLLEYQLSTAWRACPASSGMQELEQCLEQLP